jgi:hypothetical protein
MIMITLDKVERGVTRFVDAEILPHINEGWTLSFAGMSLELPASLKKAVFGTAGAVLAKKASTFLSSAGMVEGDGTVDLEILRREFMPRIPQEGFLVRLPGSTDMRLTAQDMDTLYRYVIEA